MSILPDPKWLFELFKASGPQLAAYAVAAGLLWCYPSYFVGDKAAAYIGPLAGLGMLACGSLALASFFKVLANAFPAHTWFAERSKTRKFEKQLIEQLSRMSPEEKAIIAYLLHHDRDSFEADATGGHAGGLIGREMIVRSTVAGQYYDTNAMPFRVPPNVWKILQDHRKLFPYEPGTHQDNDLPPWVVPWKVR